jgi:hypothetical protein
MAGLRHIGGGFAGKVVKALARERESLGTVHDFPRYGRIPLRLLILAMRFKMLKGGEVVGEVEKMATCSHVGEGEYEYLVELDGYEFDSLEVIVKDIVGNEIHRKTHAVSVGAGQSAVYRLLVVE